MAQDIPVRFVRQLGLVLVGLAVLLIALGLAAGRREILAQDDDTVVKGAAEGAAAAKIVPVSPGILPVEASALPAPVHFSWLEESHEHSPADYVSTLVFPRSPPQFISDLS